MVHSYQQKLTPKGTYVCEKPFPDGPFIYVGEKFFQGRRWPRWPVEDSYFLIKVTGSSESGRSQYGELITCIDDVLLELKEELLTRRWQRDEQGHSVLEAGPIELEIGTFDALVDTGRRERKPHVTPHIYFKPHPHSVLYQFYAVVRQLLVTCSTNEVNRARSAPKAGKAKHAAKSIQPGQAQA